MQSAPGSLVSAILTTSLSPVCGSEVFTTPTPQSIWSTREQSPPRMFTKKVGTMKPGWSQHPCVPRGTQPFGLPATSHPGMPAHDAFGLPHGRTVVVVAEVGVVVVLLGRVVVVVVATGVVVVLPIGIGRVGIGSVGIGTWAICTRVSATGCARPGLSPRTAKLASVAARRS